jgi:hypothetical protein
MAEPNNLTTLAKRLRPFIKQAAQEMVPVTPYDHGDLTGLGDDDHTQYVHNSTGRTILAQHQFAPNVAQAPFSLGANAQGQLVTGLRADQLNKSVIAGAGLTGGGGLTEDRTLTVGAGLGLTVNADDVALTMPGTLSISSANAAAGSHTHAITSNSNPGAAAAILASDANGYLQLVRLGVGITPSYPLHVIGEARIDGDLTFVGAQSIATTTDNLTLSPAGDLITDPVGNDILPATGYDINIGMLTKKYLSLHAAELWVETLVAQDTIATIGGRILVGPTTTLTTDLALASTSMIVKHNQMVLADTGYLEANASVEFIAIHGVELAGVSIALNYFFVAGDVDDQYPDTSIFHISGTGSINDKTWTVDHTTVVGGPYTRIYTTDDITDATIAGGHIDWRALTSAGPFTYPVVTRNLDGTGANDWTAGDAIFNTGNTGDGFIDLYSISAVHGPTKYGPTIVGNVRASTAYADFAERWAIGNLNGLYGYGTDLYGAAFGQYASGKANVTIDETNGFRLRSYTTDILQIKNSDGKGYIVGSLYLDTNGGIYQGTGTFASPTTGLKIWNDSGVGRIGGYNATVLQWYAGTDGKLYAGGGAVFLSEGGFGLALPAVSSSVSSVSWYKSGAAHMGLYGYDDTSTNELDIAVSSIASENSLLLLKANAPTTYQATLYMRAQSGGSISSLGVIAHDDDAGFGYSTVDFRVGGGLYVGSTGVDPDAGKLYVAYEDANNADQADIVIFRRNTTHASHAADNFGTNINWQLEDDTTENQTAFAIKVYWIDSATATRKARANFYAYDTTYRFALGIEGSGSAPMLGFFGTAPIVKPTGVAVTAAGIHAALIALGLIAA